QPAELHGAVGEDRDVVDDADAVAEALGATELERLPDRRQTEALAGVEGDVEVLVAHLIERLEVARRAVTGLGAGDVESDDARVAPADGAFGDLDGAGGLAHRGDERLHHDGMPGGGSPRASEPKPLEVRLDDLVEGQPLLG